MDVILAGGSIRMLQGLLSAAPTLMIGLFVAAVFRYYLRTEGTQRLFGGSSVMSLPQSWAVGMLLPVCSIGVIPIICEMRRQGIRAGSITAFALSAPLFNPLSLLYGLTLSRSSVIIGFALGSLFIVTVLGICWDRLAAAGSGTAGDDPTMISLRRLAACFLYIIRQLAGKMGLYVLLAGFGLFVLGAALPHGTLQDQVEQLDPLAPAKMSILSVFIYATPILTMSQLGMMFDHGNSPGAAFVLLLLGTGINLATLWWIQTNFGFKSAALWFTLLFASVLGVAYSVERPLIPPGIEPAGHTHAFDIYTNPYHSGDSIGLALLQKEIEKIGPFEWIAGGIVGVFLLAGLVTNLFFAKSVTAFLESDTGPVDPAKQDGLHRHVSSRTVGMTCIGGLIAFSVVGCYAFYPDPSECLEEMRLARTEVLSGVVSKDYERAKQWIPVLEGWSRRLEVGYAIRNFELRPYQKMQAYLLRKKLEDMEHAIEHQAEFADAPESDLHAAIHLKEELEELNTLRQEISANAKRLSDCFR
ncbi:MAG: permease [Pirellulaceae bacterium]